MIVALSGYLLYYYNQSTDRTSGRLSLSLGWENGPEGGLKTVSINP